ncbi:hypothetical protein SprV_0100006600 [Sparganum proliferum]
MSIYIQVFCLCYHRSHPPLLCYAEACANAVETVIGIQTQDVKKKKKKKKKKEEEEEEEEEDEEEEEEEEEEKKKKQKKKKKRAVRSPERFLYSAEPSNSCRSPPPGVEAAGELA